MSDFKARHVIEALRSGVPSRAVSQYFSEARPAMMKRLQDSLEDVRNGKTSQGQIITGRYGEGKTHLLNSVLNIALSDNMVVSMISLGKETPIDKPWMLYQKLMANTFLPGAAQPGFRDKLESMTAGDSRSGELLAYTAKELETDKLYFLLRSFQGTSDDDERCIFLADLEGDFTTAQIIKRSYRRIYGLPAKMQVSFSKTKNYMDYYCFAAHLFKQLGYDGWVILLDEAELIGRLGKKSRVKSYLRMQDFLSPPAKLENVFTLFAFSSSYADDVIDKKKEFTNVEETLSENAEEKKLAEDTLNSILKAPELVSLKKDEIMQILMSIQDFHGKAYDWHPDVSAETLYKATEAGGYLLRTKIRAAIEFFDQLYQYKEAGETRISELGKESFEEEEVPELPEL